MSTSSHSLGRYTKDQMLNLFQVWKVTEPLPGKGKKVIICFPPGNDFSLGTVTKMVEKSTYGKALYELDLTPRTLKSLLNLCPR